MELAFRTRTLRSICEDEAKAAQHFHPEVVASLKRRLADLRAADSVDDLIAGRPRLTSDHSPVIRLALVDEYELVCQMNHPNPPLDADGKLDWSRVRRLKVTLIAKQGEADA